jgi:hypothetical protein
VALAVDTAVVVAVPVVGTAVVEGAAVLEVTGAAVDGPDVQFGASVSGAHSSPGAVGNRADDMARSRQLSPPPSTTKAPTARTTTPTSDATT